MKRLQTKTNEFTRLVYTGLVVELEHLKVETRLIDEKFANAMGEYVTDMLPLSSLFNASFVELFLGLSLL